ncbi:MAG TPA: alpha/beta fold hydrolase [Lacunisphaera sp.]|nr:alpha/beta fold hydrolase [Lacunisphaera sp.]
MALNLAAAESAPKAGEIRTGQIMSPTLHSAIDYLLYLPPGYDAAGSVRYPVLYLLHGRGDNMTAWTMIKPDLDRMISAGQIPPVIAVMPDASASRRAGYYIDSQFTGSADARLPPGEQVESAFIKELLTHIDATYPTRADRAGRIVAGYSMGGYGALRYSLAHPELFGAAIILSPAVYFPLPPPDSSTREFGAFGKGAKQFDDDIYTALNYPALIPAFIASGLSLVMFIAVGDDERALANPAESAHDLDYEAHTLYNKIRRVPKITAQLRVVDGTHNWDTWRPTFIEGVQYVFSQLKPAPRPAK